MTTGTRQSAEVRRRAAVEASFAEFASSGFAGAQADVIAAGAGISQPYLFRLFGSKKNLFLAAVDACFELIVHTLDEAGRDRTGQEAMCAMGRAYRGLLADRTMLLVQLQAFAAASDDDVRALVHQHFADLWRIVAERSGLSDDDVRTFMSTGLTLNFLAAMRIDEVDAPWARSMSKVEPGFQGGAT